MLVGLAVTSHKDGTLATGVGSDPGTEMGLDAERSANHRAG
jgi:hypothetical protein